MDEMLQGIKDIRRERGLTQCEAASEMHISIKTLYRYEKGKVKRPNPNTVEKIVLFYGLNSLYMYKEDNYEKK